MCWRRVRPYATGSPDIEGAGIALCGAVVAFAVLLPWAGFLPACWAAGSLALAASPGLRAGMVLADGGLLAGLAAPEAANNTAAQTSFAPLLALGMPANAVMAMLAGAMFLQGIAPGPAVVAERPELIGAIIVSMLLGNAMLVALNLPFVGLWTAVLRLPMRLLAAVVMVLGCAGLWASTGSVVDLWLLFGFGLLGWALLRAGLEGTPLLIGYVLAAPFEEALRRALVLARGDWTVFATEPASALLLAAAAAVTALSVARRRPRAGPGREGARGFVALTDAGAHVTSADAGGGGRCRGWRRGGGMRRGRGGGGRGG